MIKITAAKLDKGRQEELIMRLHPEMQSTSQNILQDLLKDLQPGEGMRVGPFDNYNTAKSMRQRLSPISKKLGWTKEAQDPSEKTLKGYYSELVKIGEEYFVDLVRSIIPQS
jgi:hypothetical protein